MHGERRLASREMPRGLPWRAANQASRFCQEELFFLAAFGGLYRFCNVGACTVTEGAPMKRIKTYNTGGLLSWDRWSELPERPHAGPGAHADACPGQGKRSSSADGAYFRVRPEGDAARSDGTALRAWFTADAKGGASGKGATFKTGSASRNLRYASGGAGRRALAQAPIAA